jgi:hypothetical protein
MNEYTEYIELDTDNLMTKSEAEGTVVKDLAFLGAVSKHGYEYLPQALQEASQIFVGRPVCIGDERHGQKVSTTGDTIIGRIISAQYDQRLRQIRGDIKLLPPHAEQFNAIFDEFRSEPGLGFSPVLSAKVDRSGNVTAIGHVDRLDFVFNPATNRSLAEAINYKSEKEKEMQEEEKVYTQEQYELHLSEAVEEYESKAEALERKVEAVTRERDELKDKLTLAEADLREAELEFYKIESTSGVDESIKGIIKKAESKEEVDTIIRLASEITREVKKEKPVQHNAKAEEKFDVRDLF